jgi:hypothetical protein
MLPRTSLAMAGASAPHLTRPSSMRQPDLDHSHMHGAGPKLQRPQSLTVFSNAARHTEAMAAADGLRASPPRQASTDVVDSPPLRPMRGHDGIFIQASVIKEGDAEGEELA